MKVATSLSEKCGTEVKWQQCDTKWKGLNKTYREVKEHNAKTGSSKRKWEYFDVMDKILYKKPEITPVATCSSHKGLVISNEENEKKPTNDICSSSDMKEEVFKSSFARKRQNSASAAERRHAEKLMRQDKFLGYFEEYLNILRDKKSTNQ